MSDLRDQVLERRAQVKFESIYRTFLFLQKNLWQPKGIAGLEMNRDLLLLATRSYAVDLDRFRDFHKIKRADESKQACYLMKWIIKVRPVHFVSQHAQASHFIPNEWLALNVALTILKVRPGTLSEEYIELLLYTLRFRSFDADSWLPLLDLFWRMHRAQLAVPSPL